MAVANVAWGRGSVLLGQRGEEFVIATDHQWYNLFICVTVTILSGRGTSSRWMNDMSETGNGGKGGRRWGVECL